MDARAAWYGLEGWADLHVHSAYSLLDGASSPEALAARAAELGYTALALTDHDSLAGLVTHAQACAAHGIRPIAGVELTLADEEDSHLTLLARYGYGYASLARLVSTAQLAGHKGEPRATLDDVAVRSGLVPPDSGTQQVGRGILAGGDQAHGRLCARVPRASGTSCVTRRDTHAGGEGDAHTEGRAQRAPATFPAP